VCGSADRSSYPFISAARRSSDWTQVRLLWMLPAPLVWIGQPCIGCERKAGRRAARWLFLVAAAAASPTHERSPSLLRRPAMRLSLCCPPNQPSRAKSTGGASNLIALKFDTTGPDC
jgi:hypothetical protein